MNFQHNDKEGNPFPQDNSYQDDEKEDYKFGIERARDFGGLLKVLQDGDLVKDIIKKEGLYFKDLADYLMTKGYFCREAYEITSKLYKYLCLKNKSIKWLSDDELKMFSPALNRDVIEEIFDPVNSVRGKKSFGSTNPNLVRKAIAKEEKWLKSGRLERKIVYDCKDK